MELIRGIKDFIAHPFPLWESETTMAAVQYKWDELLKTKNITLSEYCTASSLHGSSAITGKKYKVFVNNNADDVYIEDFSSSLSDFYEEHGLVLYPELEVHSTQSVKKIESALELFALDKSVQVCISRLVRTIQILKHDNMEIDISYSHPEIPFSIFVSVCEDNAAISNLRVAESILHEAMHLKLSLIENILPLVKANTGNLFFSPWRDEKRPAQGILHGLFVFRAVVEFIKCLENNILSNPAVKEYLAERKEQIMFEIAQLKGFHKCRDLTEDGAILTLNLLP